MGIESGAVYIEDLVPTNPLGADDRSTADDHLRLVKSVLQSQFPNLGPNAVTASALEINILDGALLTTAELNTLAGYTGSTADFNAIAGIAALGITPTEIGYLNGVTSAIQTQLNGKLVAANNLSDVANAATSRQNLGVEIGVDVQAYDANLGQIAALTPTNNYFIVGNGSAWAAETPAQVRASLDLEVGTDVAPASKGVTNGDSHNHSGGDGAAIPYSALALSNDLDVNDLGPNCVGNSEMRDDAVGTPELIYTDTDHDYNATALSSITIEELALTGGLWVVNVAPTIIGGAGADYVAWQFGPMTAWDETGDGNEDYLLNGRSPTIFTRDSYDVTISFAGDAYTNSIGTITNDTFRIRERYLSSSPPFDLGDGEVYGFLIGQVDNSTGKLSMISIGGYPPWFYNGPTDCVPDIHLWNKDKTIMRPMKRRRVVDGMIWEDVKGNPNAEKHFMQQIGKGNFTIEMREITQQMKNADMEIVPHNWKRGCKGHTPIILDPMSEVVRSLMEMRKEGVDVTREILFKNYVDIDNTPLKRCCPKKLMPVSLSWRNTP